MTITITVRKHWLLIVAVWLVMSFLTAGFLTADCEHYLDSSGDKSCNQYRGDLAFSIGLSLLPPTWLLAPFLTGFYEHGWTLLPRRDCAEEQ